LSRILAGDFIPGGRGLHLRLTEGISIIHPGGVLELILSEEISCVDFELTPESPLFKREGK